MSQGTIVVLNGAPRSGKTSIAEALQSLSPEPWINLGVDVWMRATPEKLQPGIGLRPGGERPDLEPFVVRSFVGLYRAVAAQATVGFNVAVDVGHHDAYSRPLGILARCAREVRAFPVLFVGVRCPLPVIVARRRASEGYAVTSDDADAVRSPVERWQTEVHRDHRYDIEVDTSAATPEVCAGQILERLRTAGPGDSFAKLADGA